ncbi:glycosyltransferase family 39 protein [Mucilaginibacter sp.]|uniref:ArnT family glycosyltransferase n=1 Tax=Mucilaginibacter sp. TaxID=1882438 RepID=UPI002603FBF7|nr:glycosyltransferase family 39 protein [Mucilaginibacter sp.]MDB4924004.1 arnT 2 [Mucilaginibacter sp.]
MKKITEQNAAKYTLVLIIVTFFIRLLIAAYTGLGNGESYYFRGAIHLDWSYFDQPPLFFWLGGLSIRLLGLTNLGLRFPDVLMFAGTSWLLFILGRKLFNAAAGFWAVTVMNLSALFTVGVACWYQPDAPLMFFWLLSTWYIVKVLGIGDALPPDPKTNSRKVYLLWITIGICMGLATLSKYHVLFLFAGVFMFISTNKNQRHWLKHPGPYLAILITIIMALPIIWWNYKNNWVSFVWQGQRAGTRHEPFRIHLDWFIRSILGQAVWLLPWIWFPTIKQLFISYKKRVQAEYGFNFWMSVLPIVFFTVITLWADLQYHFHWQAPGYMMLFMPLGFAIDKRLNSADEKPKRLTRRWLNFSIYFTIITITVLGLHMTTGFWQSYGPKWVVSLGGGTVDPTIQGVDFDDIMTRFEKEGWIANKNVFAGSTRWWLTGKVDWALKGKKDIICFNRDTRNMAFLVDPKTLVGKDCVIVGEDHQETVDNDAKPFFDSVTKLADIPVIRGGIVEEHLQVYYCKNFHESANKFPDYPLYRQLMGLPPFGN